MFTYLEEWAAGRKDQIILWLPLFLGSGAAFYFSLKFEPSILFVSNAWLTAFSFLAVSYFKRYKAGFLIFFLTLALFTLLTGFCLAKLKTEVINAPVIIKETRPAMVEGTVIHTETLDGRRGTVVILEGLKIENIPTDKTPAKIRLTSKLRVKFQLGDRVKMLAKLTPPSMPVMPGAYDFRRHYFYDGIGGMGFILKPPEILESPPKNGLWLEKIRLDMGAHIKRLLPERLSGIVTALLTGERAAITEEDWDALRISGLAHIISISGLHVVLFATPIFFFSRLIMAAIPAFALRYPIKKFAALIALIGCSVYVLLVVPTVPTYRALLMTGVGLIAIMFDRSPFSLRLISFAAIVVLLFAPESIWSASFQLSFAAVLCLIMSAEWTRKYWSQWRNNASFFRKIILYVGGSVFTTLVVSIITAPLAAYHFQQIPLYSVVANALIIPMTGLLIMPSVIFSFLLWPFGLQDIALKTMAYGVEWMLAIAHSVAVWPYAAITVSAIPTASLLFFIVSFLALILGTGRLKYILCLGCLAFSIITLCFNQRAEIMASSSGALLMIRDGENAYMSSARTDKFAAENWIKRSGIDVNKVRYFPREGKIALSGGSITCSGGNCRIEKDGQKISFGIDQYHLRQDCQWADLIITQTSFRQKSCRAKVFNKFELADHGAIEIRADKRILSVAESIGIRPWAPVNDRFGSGLKARPVSGRDQASVREVYKHHSPAQE